MIHIHIRLSKSALKTKRQHPIPHPRELGDAILAALPEDCDRVEDITRYFHTVVPSFHIPEWEKAGGYLRLQGNAIGVTYSAKIPQSDLEYISAACHTISTWDGQKAQWSLEEDALETNCFVYKEGIEVAGYLGVHHYVHNQYIPKPVVSPGAPQRAILSLSTHLPASKALHLANSFHRKLVHHLPFNHQTKGSWMGKLISDDQSLSFSTICEDDLIKFIVVECPGGMTDELVEFFEQPIHCTFFKPEVSIDVKLVSFANYEIKRGTHFKTTTLACPPGKGINPKKSSPKRSAERAFIESIRFQLGIEAPLTDLQRNGDRVEATLGGLGKISMKAVLKEESSVTRGGRSARNLYELDIRTENELVLQSIGIHRKFGCGRLEVV